MLTSTHCSIQKNIPKQMKVSPGDKFQLFTIVQISRTNRKSVLLMTILTIQNNQTFPKASSHKKKETRQVALTKKSLMIRMDSLTLVLMHTMIVHIFLKLNKFQEVLRLPRNKVKKWGLTCQEVTTLIIFLALVSAITFQICYHWVLTAKIKICRVLKKFLMFYQKITLVQAVPISDVNQMKSEISQRVNLELLTCLHPKNQVLGSDSILKIVKRLKLLNNYLAENKLKFQRTEKYSLKERF